MSFMRCSQKMSFSYIVISLIMSSVRQIERKAMIRNRYNYLKPPVPRHQRERRTHLKQRHHNQNTTSKKPKGQFLSPKKSQKVAFCMLCSLCHLLDAGIRVLFQSGYVIYGMRMSHAIVSRIMSLLGTNRRPVWHVVVSYIYGPFSQVEIRLIMPSVRYVHKDPFTTYEKFLSISHHVRPLFIGLVISSAKRCFC